MLHKNPLITVKSQLFLVNEIFLLICYIILVVMVFDVDDYQNYVLTNKQQDNRMKYLFIDQKYDVMASSKRLFNTYSCLSKYQPMKTNQVKRKKESENKVNTGKSSSETAGEIMVEYHYTKLSNRK